MRLYEIIGELKSRLETVLNSSGHVAASLRATSYFSKQGYLKEQMNGIAFYHFVAELEKNYEQKKETLVSELKEILREIMNPKGLLVSFTGDEEGYEIFRMRFEKFTKIFDDMSEKEADAPDTLPVKERRYPYIDEIRPVRKNEGFKTSAGVQYVARAGKYAEDGGDLAGVLRVFRTIMNYDYLWFHIRVQGGAYGCMCNSTLHGDCTFVTYRDPHLSRSNGVFETIPDYLESFDTDDREMTKYVIGTMSGLDVPLTPAAKGVRDMSAYLSDTTYEETQKARNHVIDCTQEDIRRLAPFIRRAIEAGNICVIGNEQKIEEEKSLFMTMENLFA